MIYPHSVALWQSKGRNFLVTLLWKSPLQVSGIGEIYVRLANRTSRFFLQNDNFRGNSAVTICGVGHLLVTPWLHPGHIWMSFPRGYNRPAGAPETGCKCLCLKGLQTQLKENQGLKFYLKSLTLWSIGIFVNGRSGIDIPKIAIHLVILLCPMWYFAHIASIVTSVVKYSWIILNFSESV